MNESLKNLCRLKVKVNNQLLSLPVIGCILFQIEEPAKAGTCARDRRALQQLALNVHVKHSDLIRLTAASFGLFT